MTVRALYPGSFDPIHNGHIDIALRAGRIFDEVIVGVYDMPKKRLLFDVDERVAQAKQAFAEYPNIRVAKFSGLTVDYARESNQLDHLTPELRRVRWVLSGHGGLLEHKCSGVHETGGTSIIMGVKFNDGMEVVRSQAQTAAA